MDDHRPFLKALDDADRADTTHELRQAHDDAERAHIKAVMTARTEGYIDGWFDRGQAESTAIEEAGADIADDEASDGRGPDPNAVH